MTQLLEPFLQIPLQWLIELALQTECFDKCVEFYVDIEFPRIHIVLEGAQCRQSAPGRRFMDYQQSSQFQPCNGSVQDSPAASGYRDGLDESISLLDELFERTKDPSVALSADFVDDEY